MYNDPHLRLTFPTHGNKCSLYNTIWALKIATDTQCSAHYIYYLYICIMTSIIESTVWLQTWHASFGWNAKILL